MKTGVENHGQTYCNLNDYTVCSKDFSVVDGEFLKMSLLSLSLWLREWGWRHSCLGLFFGQFLFNALKYIFKFVLKLIMFVTDYIFTLFIIIAVQLLTGLIITLSLTHNVTSLTQMELYLLQCHFNQYLNLISSSSGIFS